MKREIVQIAGAIGFASSVLIAYSVWSYVQERDRLIAQVDQRLYAAAAAIPYVLPDDFHDRATGAQRIGPKEDRNNILNLTALNNHLDMKFLYTVVRDGNGTYRLSSSSATDEELKTGSEVRYFTAYPDASSMLKQCFEDSQTSFSKRSERSSPIYVPVFSDRWGTYRSVVVPMRSPSGNPYVAAADVDISYVTALLRQNTLQTLLAFFIFALAVLPILYVYVRTVKRKSREFRQVHQLYLDYSKRSVTDPLTQIGNRLKLDEEIKSALSHYQHFAQPFGLVMIDIDHFKAVNDRHGHRVGDAVLQGFANLLVAHSRSTDIVGRWGGEEFMILYSNTNLEGAYHHAEKLRQVIAGTVFENIQGITASFGVVQAIPGITLARLLQNVDEALYAAKNRGRNCVVTAGSN